ncbi:MAG: indolepyruvate oxidoreductase subunit beta [bacterium]
MINNIIIAGVGGQGLVLMTKILSQAAFNEGYDVKTNDVIGLSQRGGMVWGSVRFGEKIHSPNIRAGEGDIVLALESLEALRWAHILKPKGKIIYNNTIMYPTIIQQGKAEYPVEDIANLKNEYDVLELDAVALATEVGNKQMANVVMLGVLSNFLPFKQDSWESAMKLNLKPQLFEMNIEAFNKAKKIK